MNKIKTLIRAKPKHRTFLVSKILPRKKKKNRLERKNWYRASLVAQWLRICLPMQGTRVRALVWEDPTCRGANGPVSHNY